MVRKWERAQARSAVYEYLSTAFLYPESDTIDVLKENGQAVAGILGWIYGGDDYVHTLSFAQRIAGSTLEVVQEEYTGSLGHIISTDCPPYEGEYGQAHIFL